MSFFDQIIEIRFEQLLGSACFDVKYLLLEYILLKHDFDVFEQVKNIQYFKFWLIKKNRPNLIGLLYQRLHKCTLPTEFNGRMVFKALRAQRKNRKIEKYKFILDKFCFPRKRLKYGFFQHF